MCATVVYEAMEGSAAAQAGLLRGDSIVAHGIATLFDLRDQLDLHRNEVVELEYYRAGVMQSTTTQVDSAELLIYAGSTTNLWYGNAIVWFFRVVPCWYPNGNPNLERLRGPI